MADVSKLEKEGARKVVELLESRLIEIANAEDAAIASGREQPSILARAHMERARLLAKGISERSTPPPQPLIAESLIAAVGELEKTNHKSEAWGCVGALRVAVEKGLDGQIGVQSAHVRIGSQKF